MVSEEIRRVAMISLHTSPLDQPGTGDAGGMNVYVLELARRLAAQQVEVDIFTRATSSSLAPVVQAEDGIAVHHVAAGPYEGLSKAELPGQLCTFAREVLRVETSRPVGWYDAIHSHYWLSGQVGALARDRWRVPLVHSMHTMAKVKNLSLADDDTPEPLARVIGEEQVVEAADVLLANTDLERDQLIDLYDAGPDQVAVVHPGVDLSRFTPSSSEAAREALGLPREALIVMFAGRIQPLKAPDVLVRAIAVLLRRSPELRGSLVVPIVGGPSGNGLERPESLAALAAQLGVADVVRFVPPVSQAQLAHWFSAATVVAVPSYSESFGLVAIEAQACGTPVVAAAVGGLTTAVAHGRSGLLVDGHDPERWADALTRVLLDTGLREELRQGAVAHARDFSWEATAQRTLEVYAKAQSALRQGVS